MSAKVSELTVEELQQVIEDTLKRTLREVLADPDIGLELRSEFAESLQVEAEAERRGGIVLLEDFLAQPEENPQYDFPLRDK